MLSKENANEDAAPHGHTSPLQLVDKNTSSQKEPSPSQKGALRSLFGGSCTKETKTTLKSSHGLVSLSKETRSAVPEAEPDEASSDGNLPLFKLFKNHSGVPPRHVKTSSKAPIVPRNNLGCAKVNIPTLDPKHPPKDTKKRKAPMQPFSLSPRNKGLPAKTPLDALGNWKRFKTIPSTSTKARIKDADAFKSEEDLSGTSGAEVKGDSDYELPTDINE